MKVIWLDCDPGHDDAFAIILAAFTPGVKLLGISTTAGNQSLEKTTNNALRVLHVAGIQVPVVQGSTKPLVRDSKICPEIHGRTGLDGPDESLLPLNVPLKPVSKDIKAVNLMYEKISEYWREHGEQVHLVATGCLTNIALLISVYPEIIEMVKFAMLGGAIGPGNTNPVAEFNIEIDPEAAAMVMKSGLDITMVPLEVSHTCLVTDDIIATLEREKGTYKRVFGFDSPPLHDPCAVAYAIYPSLFTTKKVNVTIETQSSYASGQTIVDMNGITERPPNANVALTMKNAEFWELMTAAISRCNSTTTFYSDE